LATVLPSASGLGARETALYLLLPSNQPDVPVAMGVLWSMGVILVRLLIGLGWLWFDPGSRKSESAQIDKEDTAHRNGHDPKVDQLTLARSNEE
jgi:hypothetical protein